MRALNSLSARFAIPGSYLIAALAAACSFDASQLRTLPSSAPGGAVEPDSGASGSGGNIASPPDAPIAIGGSGGTTAGPFDAPAATGGSGGSATNPPDAPTAAGDARMRDAPGVQSDAPIGGSGGIAGGIGGGTSTGGSAASVGGSTASSGRSTAGSGGATSTGGTTGSGGAASVGGASNTGGAASTGGGSGTGAASTQDAGYGDAPIILNGTCLSNGKPARTGTVCRLATDVCDVSETCDGISTACPLDKFVAATEVCRPTAGACDVAEYCTGSSAACPDDQLLAKSAMCRPAVTGGCNVAEYCDGTHPVCPTDAFAPATTQCRGSADGNVCDPAEFCTGTSNACPADAKYTRPAAAPTGVAVAPGTLQADVSWTPITGDAGTGVTGYNVKISSISTGGWSTRGSPTTSPFTVSPITAGQPFYFVVSAYAGLPTCESANSSPAVSAQSCSAVAPTALTPTPDSAGNVTLTWTLVSGATSYNVSRGTTKGGPYTVVVNGLPATSYKDSPPVPSNGSATFYYVVRANTGNCNSPYSPEATAVVGLH